MRYKSILTIIALTILAVFSVEAASNFPTASGITGVATGNANFIDGTLMPVIRYIAKPFLWLMVVAVVVGVVWLSFGVYAEMQQGKKTMGDFILSILIGVGMIGLAISVALYVISILGT